MNRRRTVNGIVASLVVGVLISLVPAQGAVAYGRDSEFRGRAVSPVVYSQPGGRSCTVESAAQGIEYGKRGVTKFRITYELRSPNDPGYLFTYRTVGLTSGSFPNDATNYSWTASLMPNRIVFGADRQFVLWVKIVGDRGWWRRDFTRHFRLGDVYCPSTVDDEDTGVYDDGGEIIEGVS